MCEGRHASGTSCALTLLMGKFRHVMLHCADESVTDGQSSGALREFHAAQDVLVVRRHWMSVGRILGRGS